MGRRMPELRTVRKSGIGTGSSGGSEKKRYPKGVRVALANSSSCLKVGWRSPRSHAESRGNRESRSCADRPARSRAQRSISGRTGTRFTGRSAPASPDYGGRDGKDDDVRGIAGRQIGRPPTTRVPSRMRAASLRTRETRDASSTPSSHGAVIVRRCSYGGDAIVLGLSPMIHPSSRQHGGLVHLFYGGLPTL